MKLTRSSLTPYLLPPLAGFFLVAHLCLMMIRPDYPMGDPGIPWHFEWGQILFDTSTIPRHDFFSHTLHGHEWINYQWLFQWIVGATQFLGGIPLTTVVLMSVYGMLPVLLLWRMMREGGHFFVAFLLAGLAWFIMTMHSLNRPHVFTYFLFAIFLERLYRIYLGQTTLRRSWWLIPLMVFWTNVHGGFSVGLTLIAVVFLTAGVRWAFQRNVANAQITRDLFLTGFFCGCASLINPYGIGLHLHILSFLDLNVLARWQEFASPDFFDPSGNVVGFKILVFLLMIVFFIAGHSRKLNGLDLVLSLVFLHFALQSSRHIILFTLVATPVVCRGLDILIENKKSSNRLARRGYEITRQQVQLRGFRIYGPIFFLAVALFSQVPSAFFKSDFYDLNLSRESAEFIREYSDNFRRPFNSDNVGGALIYYFEGRVPVFMDDRADFYWQEFVEKKYFPVRFAGPQWQEILNEYKVDSLIITPKHPLTPLLDLSGDWRKVHEDDLNALYWRKTPIPDNPEP